MCVCWFGCEGAHQGTTAAQGGATAYTQDQSLACSAAATARSNTAGLQFLNTSTLCLGSNIMQRACVPLCWQQSKGPSSVCPWFGAPVPRWVRHVLWVKAQLLDACGPVSSSIHGINTDHLQGAGRRVRACVRAWGRAAASSDSGCAWHMHTPAVCCLRGRAAAGSRAQWWGRHMHKAFWLLAECVCVSCTPRCCLLCSPCVACWIRQQSRDCRAAGPRW